MPSFYVSSVARKPWMLVIAGAALCAFVIAAVCIFRGAQNVPQFYTIFGTTFKIDDRETLFLPSNYVNRGDIGHRLAEVKNFSLCAHWPNLEFFGDYASRSACLAVGTKPNDSIVINVKGEQFGAPPPPPELERGFGYVLRRWVDYDGAGTSRPFGETYVASQDLHGLHAYYPTGPKASPLSPVMFWQGADIHHVDTWILCLGFLPETRRGLRRCVQSFYLPEGVFSGHWVRVEVLYHEQWLPAWHAIQMDVQSKLLSMRVDLTPAQSERGETRGADHQLAQ